MRLGNVSCLIGKHDGKHDAGHVGIVWAKGMSVTFTPFRMATQELVWIMSVVSAL